MAIERKCFCCNRDYTWCGNCKNEDPTETWRYLFDNKTCLTAYNLWQAYRGKEINESELKNSLGSLNISTILASDTKVSQDFKKILGIKQTESAEPHATVKDGEHVDTGKSEPDFKAELPVSEELSKGENKKVVSKYRGSK